ncbi:MAG: hypothetical protein ACLFSE_06840 [Spirochaetia bacterium]
MKDRETWDEFAKPALSVLDESRIPFDEYRQKRETSMGRGLNFSNDAFGPFELMHRLTGHENLLFGMALDPDWVKDMVMTYTEFKSAREHRKIMELTREVFPIFLPELGGTTLTTES